MKEQELRSMIREHIRKALSEAGPSLGAGTGELERGLGKVSDRTSRLSKRQKIKAVLPILKKFGIQSSDLPMIKSLLSKMQAAEKPAEPEVEENYTAGIHDGKVTEGALDAKSAKLDKSQAWQMLLKAVESKPATQQADFVLDLINKFNLDDSVKRRLKMQIKNLS